MTLLTCKTFQSLVGPECHAVGCVTIPKYIFYLNKNKLEWLISNITVKKESSVFQFLKEISSSQFRITLKVYFGQIFFRFLTCVTCFLLLFEKHSSP